MATWLDYQSKYFHTLNLTSDDSEVISTLIDAGCEFVEKYCGREFLKKEHDRTFTVGQDGSITLDNPPISHISRVCTATGSWLTLQNNTASNASFAVTNTSLILTAYTNGVKSTNTITLTGTITALANAINAINGWEADVVSGFGSYPATDLISQQFGNCKYETCLYFWEDYQFSGDFNSRYGIIQLGMPCHTTVRVVYTGGFDDVPEDVKQATANLVISAHSGSGKSSSETLGEYSYTISVTKDLIGNDKSVLNHYRDRRV